MLRFGLVLKNTEKALSVSIVLSVHNGGRYFRDCLASIACHCDDYLELIVVDDGSTDDSIQNAEEFGAQVLRVGSRRGPAHGRNAGALAATGSILLFLDADVCVHDDTILKIRRTFERDPGIGAVFGSYDSEPYAPQFVSQFRNLLHAFMHHTGNRRASTFWSGCGAIRREIFVASKGFDISYTVPCVEDIELGARLVRDGVRIALDPSIQVKHLKRWTLGKMVATDIRHRGIFWTRLILASRRMPNDLNLRLSNRISVAMTAVLCVLSVLVAAHSLTGAPGTPLWLPPMVLAFILVLNVPFYRFLAARRGYLFAAAAVPLQLTYFFCCATAFVLGVAIHYSGGRMPKRRAGIPQPGTAEATKLLAIAGIPGSEIR
jgi:GT2 family glycosyltransferase